MKRSAIRRRTPLRQRNSSRKADAYARDFGEEAEAVRGMPCLACGLTPSDPAHVRSRGAGGGRFDIVPLCRAHHQEQHQHGIQTFAARHGLDLRAKADHIAAAHVAPLGIAGLMLRRLAVEPLTDYEREALDAWLRRQNAEAAA